MPKIFTLDTKVITIKQPCAWAIYGLGSNPKRYENRPWRPPESLVGEVILIQASKEPDKFAALYIKEMSGELPPPNLPLGAIVGGFTSGGYVDMGICKDFDHPWAVGQICWILQDVFMFPEPVACSGMRGLWKLPQGVYEKLVVQTVIYSKF